MTFLPEVTKEHEKVLNLLSRDEMDALEQWRKQQEIERFKRLISYFEKFPIPTRLNSAI